ncbi:MAG TPA: hypothetical protein VEV20_07890 [Burkholderiales bacterium]|nr:hypothetical protein [Burkholderiales bacterium]
MRISFPHTDNPIRRAVPVELLVVADHKTIRAAIDWSTMEEVLGATPIDEEAVRAFLRNHRESIEVLIAAHLYAHGVPFARHLVLTRDELEQMPAL